ncbi:MAG: ATP-grasp domain-containing protein [Labilibaculum antarcticum]
MNVLLIDDKGSPYLLDTIRCLSKEKGMNIFVLSFERKPYFNTIPYSKHVKEYVYIKHENEEEKVSAIKSAIKNWNIDAILPVKQETYLFFSKHKSKFDDSLLPPIPKWDILKTVSDKWLLSQWLNKNSFPSPKTYPVTHANLNLLELPHLIKPRLDTIGHPVKLFHDAQELIKTIENPDFNSEDFVLQENIYGEDIDISLLAKEGEIIAYTIQKGLVREAFSFASGIEFVDDKELVKQTEAIISKLNWSGIAHLDFIYHKESNSYHLLDFNPRMWSTLIGSLYAGVNFPLLMLKTAKNEKIEYKGYNETSFYLAKPALQRFRKELIHKRKLTSLKNSSWNYVVNDPLPEIMKGFGRVISILNRQTKTKPQPR